MSATTTTDKEPVLPDPTFWKRYSPRHELPLAGSASTLVHLLAIGGVVLAGLAMSWRWYGETTQPPAMSVVYLEGGSGGDGRPTGGGGGSPTKSNTEDVGDPKTPMPPNRDPKTIETPILPTPTAKSSSDETEIIVSQAAPKSDVDKAWAKVQDEIARSTAAAEKGSNNPATGRGGSGTGGGLGTGTGTGVGSGVGPGTGTGPGGATTRSIQAKILANRWQFESDGPPRERLAKIAGMGIALGYIDVSDHMFVVDDIRRRPITFRPYVYNKDIVTWNIPFGHPDVRPLAEELKVPPVFKAMIFLLPPSQEQRMADEEMRYATEKGYDLSKVEATLFDFRVQRGVYEPIVKGLAPFDNVRVVRNRTK